PVRATSRLNPGAEIAEVSASPVAVAPVDARRAAIGYLAVAAMPWCFLADTALAFARGWQTPPRLDQLAIAAMGLWALAATLAALLSAGRRFLARRSPQLVLLLVSCVLTWLVAELALGPILARVADPFHCRRPGLKFVYHPRPGVMRDVS